MVFGIFKSEKSRKLAKYTRMIIKSSDPKGSFELKSMMQQGRDREDALEGFIDIALNDPNNKNTIKKYKINKKNLEAKFEMLVVNGAGVVVRNHFVAASALVYEQTLIFLYDKKQTKGLGNILIAQALVDYFDQNKTGPVV